MIANGRFSRYLAVLLWMGFLSPTPLVSAEDSSYSSATPIHFEQPQTKLVISYVGQTRYRYFNLPSAGTVSLQFSHIIPPGEKDSADAWRIKVPVPNTGDREFYLDTMSKLTDKGATCSDILPSGRHYLLVQGLGSSSTSVPYNLTISQHKLNVEVMDENPPKDPKVPENYRSYTTLHEAFNGVSDCKDCRINSRDLTFQEELVFDRAVFVKMEGGKDNCFDDYDCDVRYTTIRGSLKVRNGTLAVKRVKVY